MGKIFESSKDRDDTIVTLLVFGMLAGILAVFHDNLTKDAIIAIVAGCVGWVTSIVNFHFSAKANGKQNEVKKEE